MILSDNLKKYIIKYFEDDPDEWQVIAQKLERNSEFDFNYNFFILESKYKKCNYIIKFNDNYVINSISKILFFSNYTSYEDLLLYSSFNLNNKLYIFGNVKSINFSIYNGIIKFTIFYFNENFNKIKEESKYFKKIINEQDLCISEEEKVMSKMLSKQYIDSDFVYTNINNKGDVNDGI